MDCTEDKSNMDRSARQTCNMHHCRGSVQGRGARQVICDSDLSSSAWHDTFRCMLRRSGQTFVDCALQ